MSEEKEILLDRPRGLDATPERSTAEILGERRHLSEEMSDDEAERRMASRSRRSFLVGGAAALIGVLGWRWMPEDTKADLLRRTLQFNERVSQLFYSPRRLAPEFPRDRVIPQRTNGLEGLQGDFDPANWQLAVSGVHGRSGDVTLTMDDIRRLPRTDMTVEFKCIEGWSTIVHWAGVRFSDFAAAYPPQTASRMEPDFANRPDDLVPYVAMWTPDEGYFVGWDMPSIMHPQTLLAYELNGEPLKTENGAPLRIASATKYGIKQIKRIGRIEYTTERPRDFWAEQGYDWYAGF